MGKNRIHTLSTMSVLEDNALDIVHPIVLVNLTYLIDR